MLRSARGRRAQRGRSPRRRTRAEELKNAGSASSDGAGLGRESLRCARPRLRLAALWAEEPPRTTGAQCWCADLRDRSCAANLRRSSDVSLTGSESARPLRWQPGGGGGGHRVENGRRLVCSGPRIRPGCGDRGWGRARSVARNELLPPQWMRRWNGFTMGAKEVVKRGPRVTVTVKKKLDGSAKVAELLGANCWVLGAATRGDRRSRPGTRDGPATCRSTCGSRKRGGGVKGLAAPGATRVDAPTPMEGDGDLCRGVAGGPQREQDACMI